MLTKIIAKQKQNGNVSYSLSIREALNFNSETKTETIWNETRCKFDCKQMDEQRLHKM